MVGLCFDIAGDGEVSTLGESFAQPLNFASADLIFTIDGERSTFATSTGAYGDEAFSFIDSPRSTAFMRSWNLKRDSQMGPKGRSACAAGMCSGNEVDFAQELKVTRELAQRDTSYVRLHRSIAYYYAP